MKLVVEAAKALSPAIGYIVDRIQTGRITGTKISGMLVGEIDWSKFIAKLES